MASRKPAKATQKCASTSFLARNTADPFSAARPREELIGGDDLHPRPHRLVAGAAVLVARHEVLAGLAKRHGERGHRRRNQPDDRVSHTYHQAVDGSRPR